MGIIEWLNANSGAVIGIATVVLVGITGIYAYLTWRLLKANNTPEMAATVYIYANDHLSFEIPDDIEYPLVENNQQLSYKEFKAALEEWDALVKKFARPGTEPLSDYAMSRESIYEGHPKL